VFGTVEDNRQQGRPCRWIDDILNWCDEDLGGGATKTIRDWPQRSLLIVGQEEEKEKGLCLAFASAFHDAAQYQISFP